VDRRGAHRILLVLSNLGTGGAEWQVMHLARGLAARGHDVTVVALGRAIAPVEPLRRAGVRIVILGAVGPRARLRALPKLTRLARRADLVHCTNWDPSLYGRLAALAARRPVVVADHSTSRVIQVSRRGAARGRWVAAHHRLLARRTAATVICARSQEPLLLSEGVPPERLVCIPNGVPVAEIRDAASRGPSRSKLGLPEEATVVMHLAHFRREKNQEQTLATVAELRRDLGDIRAVFVGTGPEEEAIRRRAARMGADWALFLGRRTDSQALLGLADLLVLPSRSDTMPMTILEAAALGVPVVAYDVGDVRSMLEETGGGLVVPHLDGEALTAACRRVLADRDLRQELSRRGSAAAPRFDADAMVDRYGRLFNAVIASRAPRGPQLRVAHVGPDMRGRGGMPAVLSDLFASPLAERHRFEFISTYDSSLPDPRAHRWKRLVSFGRGLLKLVAWSLGRGPRLVHVHTATRGSWYRKSICVLVVRAARRPVILHVHAGPGDIAAFCHGIGPLRRWIFARAFRAADRVVSVSAASARAIERGLGVSGVVTLPSVPPRARLQGLQTGAAGSARARADAVEALYLGGFADPVKGGGVLIDAIPRLLAAAPGICVSLAGPGPAPAIDADRVRWLGWLERPRVAGALAGADIVVLPSISEGLPMVLLEALALGRPVVATRVGGIPEVIRDDVEGALVEPGDALALAHAIAALAEDPARRARLGRAALDRAAELARDDEPYRRLDALYRELVVDAA
jgi:glycosyltransferase involved in cell wall biosynthesis